MSDVDLRQESLFPGAPPTTSAGTGVLATQHIEELVWGGALTASTPFDVDQIQPASIDLRLGSVAYRVRASFLPGHPYSVEEKLALMDPVALDLSQPAVLERGCVYIVPLQEQLHLPRDVRGKANPKSSTGRLDVFTRLISDHAAEFDSVAERYRGKLYLEVVPRAFSIVVRAGTRLSQLRLIRGTPVPWDAHLVTLHEERTLVFDADSEPIEAEIANGLRLGVDLRARRPDGVIGYRARPNAPVIDLDRIGHYDPLAFWEPIVEDESRSLVLNPGDFYILVSKQRVRIPNDFAADMVPYDPAIGEFRVHYAGFFDPGFGFSASDPDQRGTPAVLEVRSYEVPFRLDDGQLVARLVYERLIEPPTRVYGSAIGSSYQGQGLTLAKQFRRDPRR